MDLPDLPDHGSCASGGVEVLEFHNKGLVVGPKLVLDDLHVVDERNKGGGHENEVDGTGLDTIRSDLDPSRSLVS